MSDGSLESLRNIATKVDALLETLGGAPTEPPPSALAEAAPGAAPGAVQDAALGEHLLRISATLQPQALWEAILDGLVELTGGERAFLMLLEEGNKLRFKTGRNVDHASLAGQEFAGSRQLIKTVLQEGQPRLIVGEELPMHGLIHLGGVICAPIRYGGRLDGRERTKGALYVDLVGGERTFQPRHLELARALALAAGVALENAELVARSQSNDSQVLRLRGNLSRLHDVGRSINSTLILEDLLVQVVDHVVEVSRAQRGFVMLLEGPPEDRNLVYRAGRDARHNTIAEADFNYSTTVAQRALEQNQPVVMVDALGSDLSVSMVQMDLQSIMCVPLSEKGEVFGLLYVDSRKKNREFDQSDLELLESLAGHASVAIINAKLYQEARERERLAHELEIAARLQRDMLPEQVPAVEGLELFGTLTPALEVGGDYYDFIPHEGTTASLTIAIGDVSGKGVGAGLVMAMARSALRSLVEHHGVPESPLPIVRSLNVMLCRDIPPEMFMTMNVMLWDAERRCVRYTSAGHEHVLVYRAATGEVEAIKGGGVACGVLEQASGMMAQRELTLAPGDQILLYTDGVTETMDVQRQSLGLEAVIGLLREHGRLTPQELCQLVEEAVNRHRGEADPHDDITLVALRAT